MMSEPWTEADLAAIESRIVRIDGESYNPPGLREVHRLIAWLRAERARAEKAEHRARQAERAAASLNDEPRTTVAAYALGVVCKLDNEAEKERAKADKCRSSSVPVADYVITALESRGNAFEEAAEIARVQDGWTGEEMGVLISERDSLRAEREAPVNAVCRDTWRRDVSGSCPVHGGDACLVSPFGLLAAHEIAEKRVRQAEEDVRLVNESHDALEVKLKALSPHESCACSYDREGDVCLHHSPALVAVTAERDTFSSRLEQSEAGAAALRAVAQRLVTEHPAGEDGAIHVCDSPPFWSDCQIAAEAEHALASDAGASVLARLAAAEKLRSALDEVTCPARTGCHHEDCADSRAALAAYDAAGKGAK